jgi:acyl carrier protein
MAEALYPCGSYPQVKNEGKQVEIDHEVLSILEEVLSLNGRALSMGPESRLLGAIPELDSMAVVAVLTSLEDRFGFTIEDDELDASSFETVGALADFVSRKVSA